MRFATGLILLVALVASTSAAAAGSSTSAIRTAALAPISKESLIASKALQKVVANADATSLAADNTLIPAAASALRALGEKFDTKALCSAAASVLKSSSSSVSSLASAAEASKTAGCSPAATLPASAESALASALLSESFADVQAALSAIAHASPSAATSKTFPSLSDAFSLIADLIMPDGTTRASATSIASSPARTGLAAQAAVPLIAALGASAPASAARLSDVLSVALPKAVTLAASQQASLPDVAAILAGLAAAPASVASAVDASTRSALAALVSAGQDGHAPASVAAVASSAAALAAAPAAAAPLAVTVSRVVPADGREVTVGVTDIWGAPATGGAETFITIKGADGSALATKLPVPASGRVSVPALASAAGPLRVGVTVSRKGAQDVSVVRRSLKAVAVTEGSAAVFLSDKKAEADSARASSTKGIAKLGAAFDKPLTLDAAAGGKYLRADVSVSLSSSSVAIPVVSLRLVPKAHPARAAVFPLPARQGRNAGAYALLSPAVRSQLSGDGDYTAFVDVASAALAAPVAWKLGSVTLAGLGAWVPAADVTALPSPLFHTFAPAPTTPPAVISLAFAAAALALFLGLAAAVTASVCPKAVPAAIARALKGGIPSVAAGALGRWTVPFVGAIGGALVLNGLYWWKLNIFQALVLNGVVGIPVLLVVGHRALSETHAKAALVMGGPAAGAAGAAAGAAEEDDNLLEGEGEGKKKKGASVAAPAAAAAAAPAAVPAAVAREEKKGGEAAKKEQPQQPQQQKQKQQGGQQQQQQQQQGKKNKGKKNYTLFALYFSTSCVLRRLLWMSHVCRSVGNIPICLDCPDRGVI